MPQYIPEEILQKQLGAKPPPQPKAQFSSAPGGMSSGSLYQPKPVAPTPQPTPSMYNLYGAAPPQGPYQPKPVAPTPQPAAPRYNPYGAAPPPGGAPSLAGLRGFGTKALDFAKGALSSPGMAAAGPAMELGNSPQMKQFQDELISRATEKLPQGGLGWGLPRPKAPSIDETARLMGQEPVGGMTVSQLPTQQLNAMTPAPPKPNTAVSPDDWDNIVRQQAASMNTNPPVEARPTTAGGFGYTRDEQGVYRPSATATPNNRISTIGMRRVPEATPATPTPVVAAPEQPDYSGVISDLVAQSQVQGNPRSFDSLLAAKNQRNAAISALDKISGIRGQDINAATDRGRMQQEGAQFLDTLGQRRSEQDLAAQQFEQNFGAQRDALAQSRADTAAQHAAAAANQAQTRDLAERRFALDSSVAKDNMARQASEYENTVNKTEFGMQQDRGKQQALAQMYLAKVGGQLAVDPATGKPTGKVLSPSSLPFVPPSVDDEATTVYNAILQGVAPPAQYLFGQQ